MGLGNYVRLKCEPGTLGSLASGLTHYARVDGEPEWLVSGVWLRAGRAQYLATATVAVLSDGFVARGLSIGTPEEHTKNLEGELLKVAARLAARGNAISLPEVETPFPPQHLNRWAPKAYATKVLVRVSGRASTTHRVACGLLFAGAQSRLLLGSDPSTLALVLSDDLELIDRYCSECEALTPAKYLAGG